MRGRLRSLLTEAFQLPLTFMININAQEAWFPHCLTFQSESDSSQPLQMDCHILYQMLYAICIILAETMRHSAKGAAALVFSGVSESTE